MSQTNQANENQSNGGINRKSQTERVPQRQTTTAEGGQREEAAISRQPTALLQRQSSDLLSRQPSAMLQRSIQSGEPLGPLASTPLIHRADLKPLPSDSAAPIVQRADGGLRVNDPNDSYEKHADEVSASIMKMPSKVQRDDDETDGYDVPSTLVQRDNGGFEVGTDFENRLNSLSGGSSIPESKQAKFAQATQHDTSGMKLYHKPDMAREIGAKAFTYGSKIVHAKLSDETLYHEMTHGIHQGSAKPIAKKDDDS